MRIGKKLIALAGLIRENSDALVCDFAETYQIYDYRSLPVPLVATLAAGLRDGSRIAIETTEAKASTTNTLLAIIADHLRAIRMFYGDKDLPYVLSALYQLDNKDDSEKVKKYRTGSDFMRAWQEINEE